MWIDYVSQKLLKSRRLFIYSTHTYERKHNFYKDMSGSFGDYRTSKLMGNEKSTKSL